MKKIGYLLLLLVMFTISVVGVNAEELFPYEEGIKNITLYTYDGVYTTRKITGNYGTMRTTLEAISDKTENEEAELTGDKHTKLELSYYNDEMITITFYDSNLISVKQDEETKVYDVNYDGNCEETVIELFSGIIVNKPGETSNPQTSDNIITVAILVGVACCIAVASYRKLKLS